MYLHLLLKVDITSCSVSSDEDRYKLSKQIRFKKNNVNIRYMWLQECIYFLLKQLLALKEEIIET